MNIIYIYMYIYILEAFSVHNARSELVVLHLGDPHLVEGGERGENGSPNPHRVLPLGGSDHLHLHGGGHQFGEFRGHTVRHARVHCGTAREDEVVEQVFPDIQVTFHHRVVHFLMNTTALHSCVQQIHKLIPLRIQLALIILVVYDLKCN